MKSTLLFCLVFAAATVSRAGLQKDVEYATADGVSLKLDAYVPDGPGPFPAAILVHGGGWSSGDKTGGPHRALIAPMEDPLAAAGFAWFSIDYRLAPAHPYPACVEDLETAIRWVKAHAAEYRVDPNRIAIAGESAGGQMVAVVGAQAYPATRVAAVVVFYGPSDLPADIRELHGKEVALKQVFGAASFDEVTPLLVEASAATYVRPGLPPFLLVHGSGDQKVPYQQSVDFQAKLRAAGVPCDLLTIPGGAHGMVSWSKIDPHYRDKVVAWLLRSLPEPKPGP
jgi:alpha-L-fucosidase 2